MRKTRKVRKYRGSKTHGGGSMKKRRGAGSRGGRGRAGSGKRGDANKPSYWKTWSLGGKGFSSKVRKQVHAVNVSAIDREAKKLVKEGLASEKSGLILIDLTEIGVNKLIGSGQVRNKLSIKVDTATKSAIKKVHDAGGSVVVTKTREPVEEAQEVAEDAER